jgi:hypothetical protein
MWHAVRGQRNFLAALLAVTLLGIVVPAGASGGAGGAGGEGGAGGAGGESIGVAKEADSACCCTVPVSGPMDCQIATACPPYTTNIPDACGSSVGVGGCSAVGVRSGAVGVDVVEVFVILLALAFGVMHRRFAWRSEAGRSRRRGRFQLDC